MSERKDGPGKSVQRDRLGNTFSLENTTCLPARATSQSRARSSRANRISHNNQPAGEQSPLADDEAQQERTPIHYNLAKIIGNDSPPIRKSCSLLSSFDSFSLGVEDACQNEIIEPDSAIMALNLASSSLSLAKNKWQSSCLPTSHSVAAKQKVSSGSITVTLKSAHWQAISSKDGVTSVFLRATESENLCNRFRDVYQQETMVDSGTSVFAGAGFSEHDACQYSLTNSSDFYPNSFSYCSSHVDGTVSLSLVTLDSSRLAEESGQFCTKNPVWYETTYSFQSAEDLLTSLDYVVNSSMNNGQSETCSSLRQTCVDGAETPNQLSQVDQFNKLISHWMEIAVPNCAKDAIQQKTLNKQQNLSEHGDDLSSSASKPAWLQELKLRRNCHGDLESTPSNQSIELPWMNIRLRPTGLDLVNDEEIKSSTSKTANNSYVSNVLELIGSNKPKVLQFIQKSASNSPCATNDFQIANTEHCEQVKRYRSPNRSQNDSKVELSNLPDKCVEQRQGTNIGTQSNSVGDNVTIITISLDDQQSASTKDRLDYQFENRSGIEHGKVIDDQTDKALEEVDYNHQDEWKPLRLTMETAKATLLVQKYFNHSASSNKIDSRDATIDQNQDHELFHSLGSDISDYSFDSDQLFQDDGNDSELTSDLFDLIKDGHLSMDLYTTSKSNSSENNVKASQERPTPALLPNKPVVKANKSVSRIPIRIDRCGGRSSSLPVKTKEPNQSMIAVQQQMDVKTANKMNVHSKVNASNNVRTIALHNRTAEAFNLNHYKQHCRSTSMNFLVGDDPKNLKNSVLQANLLKRSIYRSGPVS